MGVVDAIVWQGVVKRKIIRFSVPLPSTPAPAVRLESIRPRQVSTPGAMPTRLASSPPPPPPPAAPPARLESTLRQGRQRALLAQLVHLRLLAAVFVCNRTRLLTRPQSITQGSRYAFAGVMQEGGVDWLAPDRQNSQYDGSGDPSFYLDEIEAAGGEQDSGEARDQEPLGQRRTFHY